jgi:hypothetical protein
MELRTADGTIRPGCLEYVDGEYRFPATFLNDELCELEPLAHNVDEWRAQRTGLILLTPSNSCRFEEDDA